MNFLAHFFLAFDEPDLMVGNFLADFLNKRQTELLSESVQKGILLHRSIDTFTDNHPEVKKSVQKLRPRHRKYAPVIVDVFYDYFLHRNWEQFSGTSKNDFSQKVYAALQDYYPHFPDFLQHRVKEMVDAEWLDSYGTLDGLSYTFLRMRARTSHPEWLDGAIDSLQALTPVLEADFVTFFPDLIQHAEEWRANPPLFNLQNAEKW
jgi:acyl carrier protein phosphodiesterase